MEFNFNQKKVLVTGAGRGIGRDIVRLLVQCNAKVVAVSKTREHLMSLKKDFDNIETICVDIGDWNGTKEALSHVTDVEFLVNNAAYAHGQLLGQVTEDEVDRHYAVNVKAVINITQILCPAMKQRGHGSIVNVSSIASLRGLVNHLVYGGTKAALDLMTKTMALELGPFGIRVNSVNPTVCMTDMGKAGWSDPDKCRRLLDKTPLNCFAEPEDVSRAVVFLLSDHASMISGTVLPIDGGLTNVIS